jgi:hypothetical protein
MLDIHVQPGWDGHGRFLLALTGPALGGKDSFAARLATRLGARGVATTHVKFADAIRRVVEVVVPDTSAAELATVEGKARRYPLRDCGGEDATGRELQQRVAQALRVGFYCDVWTSVLEAQVNRLPGDSRVVLLSDLRMPEELEWVRATFAERSAVVRVWRPGPVCPSEAAEGQTGAETFEPAHVTEAHWDTFAVDFDVRNDGTFEDLERDAECVAACICSWGGEDSSGPYGGEL